VTNHQQHSSLLNHFNLLSHKMTDFMRQAISSTNDGASELL